MILLMLAILPTLFLLKHILRPRPLPGIPYNPSSALSPLGDLPSLISHFTRTGQLGPWFATHIKQLRSPLTQVLRLPFTQPWILLADHRETTSIFTRQTHVFDRGSFHADIFVGIMPAHHIRLRSSEPRFKAQRALLRDLMAPAFLRDVVAPWVFVSTGEVVRLWRHKARVAGGRPFAARGDVYAAALDVIWWMGFGREAEEAGAVMTAVKALEKDAGRGDAVSMPEDVDAPVEFPDPGLGSEVYDAVVTLSHCTEGAVSSGVPWWHGVLTRVVLPEIRRAHRVKNRTIEGEIRKAMERIGGDGGGSKSAVMEIVRRECEAAEKEGREPEYFSRAISDEIFGLVVTGHETTSSTLSWILKYMEQNQSYQTRLRSDIRSHFPSAVAEKRSPSLPELLNAKIPYLDAFLEESIRHSLIVDGMLGRQTTQDTEIFGRPIPKGTHVFFITSGPDYFEPGFEVDEGLRSEYARELKGKVGRWEEGGMGEFNPERWLVRDEGGMERFDPNAGPHISFALGPRSCFGRKMAYLQMRMVVMMLVWEFEFLAVPEEISGGEAVVKLARQPKNSFVRLRECGYS